MPKVSGSLKLVTGSPSSVSQVWLRAPNGRVQGAEYVTEAPDTIQVTGGAVSFDALPGALVMTLVSHGAPLQTVKLVVPDKSTVTLAECIEAAELATDGTRNALERLALEVQAELGQVPSLVSDALAQDSAIVDAATQAVDGVVGTKWDEKADKTAVNEYIVGIGNPTQSANELRDTAKTYYWSSDGNATGKNLPVDRAGVLTNHRANFNDSFTVQTYLPFRDPNLYVRYFYQNAPYIDGSTDADGWLRFPSSTAVESLVADTIANLTPGDESLTEVLAAKADKSYVDELLPQQGAADANLNDYQTEGDWYWPNDSDASTERGFPINKAGRLNVNRWSWANGAVVQTYLPFRHDGIFMRFTYQGSPHLGDINGGWMEYKTHQSTMDAVSDAISTALGDGEGAAPARSSLTSITCFGDSLTDGYSNNVRWGDEESYPAALGRELGPGVTVTERGMSGATSATINLRAGATPVTFRVPAGTIPGARWSVIPLETGQKHDEWASGTVTRYGYIGGGYGTLKLADGAWTFTRGETVDDMTADVVEFLGEFKDAAGDTIIYGAGRNDITKNRSNIYASPVESVKASVVEMLDFANADVKQVAFLGTITRTDETPESAGYKQVYEINDWIRERYPDRHIDLQGYLTGSQVWTDTGLTPTQADLDAQAQGMTPPSLFDDVTHYSKATAEVIGSKLVAGWLRARGWVV